MTEPLLAKFRQASLSSPHPHSVFLLSSLHSLTLPPKLIFVFSEARSHGVALAYSFLRFKDTGSELALTIFGPQHLQK